MATWIMRRSSRAGKHDPGEASDWTLWQNLARKSPIFGKPEKFCGDVDKSMWESVTLTCKPLAVFVDRLKELSVNDPYSGKTVTGGIITFTDSNWMMSFTCNRQPHFPDPAQGCARGSAVYALLMDKPGNYVKKPMPACTGREILAELCHHLGIDAQARRGGREHQGAAGADALHHRDVHAPRCGRPAACRARNGCTNLGLMGQFVETLERHHLHDGQFDPHRARCGLHAAQIAQARAGHQPDAIRHPRAAGRRRRALNNNEPFPGERLLHRLLDKTYFAHILPPLPDPDATRRGSAEREAGRTARQGRPGARRASSAGWSGFWESIGTRKGWKHVPRTADVGRTRQSAYAETRLALFRIMPAVLDLGRGATRSGTPLSWWAPRSLKRMPDAGIRSLTALETRTSPALAFAATRAPIWIARPMTSFPVILYSPACIPIRISSPSVRTASRIAVAQLDPGRRCAERRQQPVPGRYHLLPRRRLQFAADGGVIVVHHLRPPCIAEPRGLLGGSDDIDEQDGGERLLRAPSHARRFGAGS